MPTPILERFKLNGRIALGTGAGQGIGEGLRRGLAKAGARGAVVDVNGANAEKVAAAIKSYNKEAIAVTCDIRFPEQVEGMVSQITSHFGDLHIAFNNAGINRNSASEETSLIEWNETYEVNLRGLSSCYQADGRVMLTSSYRKIINTASMSSV